MTSKEHAETSAAPSDATILRGAVIGGIVNGLINGLLRQYFPDGTDLSAHSQTHLNKIARRLNQRPRKTLAFNTPADKLREAVASTG